MSSVQLLDKTRKISKLLHNNSNTKVVFNDICRIMMDITGSDVFVISRKGKVLGIGDNSKTLMKSPLLTNEVGAVINKELNERLLGVLSTKENVRLETLGFENPALKSFHGIVSPIYIAGKRLGTLFMYKKAGEYNIDDIIVTEYGASVVGLEMMRAVSEEKDEDSRKRALAHSALDTLSATENKAIGHILNALTDGEGILVASKIADMVGITRSVIVNALRKLESAGIVECRSAGMKGTYIKVINEIIYDVMEEEGI